MTTLHSWQNTGVAVWGLLITRHEIGQNSQSLHLGFARIRETEVHFGPFMRRYDPDAWRYPICLTAYWDNGAKLLQVSSGDISYGDP